MSLAKSVKSSSTDAPERKGKANLASVVTRHVGNHECCLDVTVEDGQRQRETEDERVMLAERYPSFSNVRGPRHSKSHDGS